MSVIVPFVREWPQVAFTLRSIHEVLLTVEHEILAIDNLVPSLQGDRATSNVEGMAKEWEKVGWPWLKYYKYSDHLSHWQCKNFGIEKAKGDFLWFIDSHCIMPIRALEALEYYIDNFDDLNGSLHMPLTYHILEPRQLMYKCAVDIPKGDYHYKFHSFSQEKYKDHDAVEVPAMSTCGMMINKEYMERLGNWPTELGIYGGGENFMNFTMAVLGMKKWVWVGDSLCHHGDKRGYNWNLYDQQKNRAAASYMFGGKRLLKLWLDKVAKLSTGEKRTVERSILKNLRSHRSFIKAQQLYEIEEWVDLWKNDELMIGEFS